MTTDRSHWPTRKIALEAEGREPALSEYSPGQLVEMVWELTMQSWTFKNGIRDEPRLRRDVVRVVRARPPVNGERIPDDQEGGAGRPKDLADVAALEDDA